MSAAARKNNTTASDGTRDCLNFSERPSTPPHIQKFRRAASKEPGKYYSRFDDAENLKLKEKVFGCTSEQGDCSAAALINLPKKTLLEDVMTNKNEQIYYTTRREPLGHSYTRNHVLPKDLAEG